MRRQKTSSSVIDLEKTEGRSTARYAGQISRQNPRQGTLLNSGHSARRRCSAGEGAIPERRPRILWHPTPDCGRKSSSDTVAGACAAASPTNASCPWIIQAAVGASTCVRSAAGICITGCGKWVSRLLASRSFATTATAQIFSLDENPLFIFSLGLLSQVS